jgi:hypothetical protein
MTMRQYLTIVAAMGVLVWTGCQSEREEPEEAISIRDAFGNGVPAEKGIAELVRFESEEELETYFKDQILANNTGYGGGREDDFDLFVDDAAFGEAADTAAGPGNGEAAPPPQAGQGEAAADDGDGFSGTTIQEEGVDEADVVKTDGEFLYVMSGRELRIVRATPPAELELLSTYELEGYGQDLYLVGDLAVALTSTGGGFYGGPIAVDVVDAAFQPMPVEPWFVPRPQSVVTILDVSDRAEPALVQRTALDGTIAASRMIDGVLRLVLANYPYYYYDLLPLGGSGVEPALAQVDSDDLLPDYETTDAEGQVTQGNVVEWGSIYRPADADGFGVTTVVTLDTAAPGDFDAVAVLAEPGLIYASTEALYLTDTEWYYDYRRVDTDIYKFAFEPDTVVPVGAGTVPGRVLNQYSMGEFDGYLRVATTTDDLWIWETNEQIPSTNSVYVLGEADGKLAVVGSIEDLAVGEEIQSARFIGRRGYVVTFEQIDPLFTLDLSNPAAPRVVGELKVPGFSTFITPMDDDHLLTVGVYVDPQGPGWSQGVQLSVFDVSNFANPQLVDSVVIGDSNTYSEATHNPKAFTYFAARDVVALPIEHYAGPVFIEPGFDEEGVAEMPDAEPPPPRPGPMQPITQESFQGLLVYQVTADQGFDYLGRLSTKLDNANAWWTAFTRGVFIDDHVYAVTERAVVNAPVATMDTVTASISLPAPVGFPDEPGTASSDADSAMEEPSRDPSE